MTRTTADATALRARFPRLTALGLPLRHDYRNDDKTGTWVDPDPMTPEKAKKLIVDAVQSGEERAVVEAFREFLFEKESDANDPGDDRSVEFLRTAGLTQFAPALAEVVCGQYLDPETAEGIFPEEARVGLAGIGLGNIPAAVLELWLKAFVGDALELGWSQIPVGSRPEVCMTAYDEVLPDRSAVPYIYDYHFSWIGRMLFALRDAKRLFRAIVLAERIHHGNAEEECAELHILYGALAGHVDYDPTAESDWF